MSTHQLLFATALFISLTASAQDLKLKVDAYTIDGPADDITLTIEHNGAGMPNVLQGVKQHKLLLEPGETYTLTYSKPNFVSKTIVIDTPEELEKRKTIEFDVRLDPQNDRLGKLVYTAPVGHVYFDEELKMNYSKNYQLTITDRVTVDIKN